MYYISLSCVSCSFKEIFRIVSYTRKLCRLKLSYLVSDDNEEDKEEYIVPILLKDLKNLSIERYDTTFIELKLY